MNTENKTIVVSNYYNANIVWISMLLLTALTYLMGKFEFSGTAVMLIILSTAAIKATLIIRDFMGLKGVSLLWRIIMYGWLSIVCLSIAIAYIISL